MGEYKQYRFIQKSLKWLIDVFVQTLVGSKLAVNKQINVINHFSIRSINLERYTYGLKKLFSFHNFENKTGHQGK